eukprot:1312012-Pyramimonas_sp.AAC.1
MNRVLVEAGQQFFRPGRMPQYQGDAALRRELLQGEPTYGQQRVLFLLGMVLPWEKQLRRHPLSSKL